ncbi:MAG: uracil-DNA glycosylase [Alphaproteobacteria bacterium]|nr:uracil-DNA glycosylase [Alphaproteobacteria bacterium]
MGEGELEALVRDVRAALDDLAARGIREELVTAALPAGDETEAPRSEDRPEPVSAWTDLARGARVTGPVGAAALRQIREELGDCTRCGLCKTRKNIVFGVGSGEADLVVVGEGPGQQEDEQGEPFVGPAGQMLDKMLENVLGLGRTQTYILNVVKCRPPKNRNPLPDEVEACRPFMEAQIRALQPKVMLVLGSVAWKTLMQTEQGIMRARGRWHVYRDPGSDFTVPVMPTFHPAYLLRTPEDKRLTFADLKAVRQRYDDEGGRR